MSDVTPLITRTSEGRPSCMIVWNMNHMHIDCTYIHVANLEAMVKKKKKKKFGL